jgi:hypothetical protein
MAFTSSNLKVATEVVKESPVPEQAQLTPQLNLRELEILLSLVKKSTFLGEDIEPLYNMVIKLQTQYLDQTK